MSQDLPPEAFTKETLQKAFNWLQEQPEPVRKTVHTPERLVSLFRKSQRLNDQDAPVSSKKFVKDLKSLASSLDQFSDSPGTPSFSVPSAPVDKPSPPPEPITPEEPPAAVPPLFDFSPQQAARSTSPKENSPSSQPLSSSPREQSPYEEPMSSLDTLSEQRILEIQTRFNLSSKNEALRLLISLGFEKISQL